MNRYSSIDILRGLSFFPMFIFHFFSGYDLVHSTNLSKNKLIFFFGLVRNLYLILAGVSLAISAKKLNKDDNSLIKIDKDELKNYFINRFKRSGQILLHGLILTVITHILFPDQGIKFGILHFIAFSTLLLSPIAISQTLTIIVLFISIFVKFPIINSFFDTITGAEIHYSTIDWFPLNKNLPLMLIGILIGHVAFNNNNKNKNNNKNNTDKETMLEWIGKNSLYLYTSHMVIILIVYYYLAKHY